MNSEELLNELESDPAGFDEKGRAYQLLEVMFDSFGKHERLVLRGLLRSEDVYKHRIATFVLSEIGVDVTDLVDDIAPLLTSPDRRSRYTAAELVTRYSDTKPRLFAGVTRLLEDTDPAIRSRAAELATRASPEQLEGALTYETDLDPASTHTRGLRLLAHPEGSDTQAIDDIASDAPLVRIYAAIYAVRRGGDFLRKVNARNRDAALSGLLMQS